MRSLTRHKSIRWRAEQIARGRAETQDARVWEILPEERICRVKIQGSDDPIEARYPEHMHKIPSWLKVTNAVKILHTAGNRTSVEVTGSGLAIPTPEPGAAADPTLATGQNCVLTGCQVFAAGDMQVWVQTGTYRINDTVYSTSFWTMSADSTVCMSEDSPLIMGQVADVIQLSAADATGFRFDLVCIGADQEIDYIVGTPSATAPEKPVVPAGHVAFCYVLVPPGVSMVGQENINQSFVAPIPAALTVSATNLDLPWAVSSAQITVEVVDQYGRPVVGNWVIAATILSGSGSVDRVDSILGGSSLSVTYRRSSPQGASYEVCPVFIKFKLEQYPNLTNQTAIVLRDELGMLIVDG